MLVHNHSIEGYARPWALGYIDLGSKRCLAGAPNWKADFAGFFCKKCGPIMQSLILELRGKRQVLYIFWLLYIYTVGCRLLEDWLWLGRCWANTEREPAYPSS